MTSSIPGPVLDFVRTLTRAVDTASLGDDVAAYDTAIARLATHAGGGRVLGDVLRSMLEETHPDGLDSDDITLVVGRSYRAAAAWLPPGRVDAIVLLAALAGALGIHEPGVTYAELDLPPSGFSGASGADEWRDPDDSVPVVPPSWPEFAWHAPLLIADLLPFAPATLKGYLETTFAEYAREAREEFP